MATGPPHRQVVPSAPVDDGSVSLRFDAWVHKLSTERLSLEHIQFGGSGDGRAVTIGDPTGNHFTFRWVGSGMTQVEVTEAVGVSDDAVSEILADASARIAAHDFDVPVVYCVEMQIPMMTDLTSVHFLRTLNDQVRQVGPRRLWHQVLLDFEEEQQADGAIFAPAAKVRVTIFAPGPGPSYWTATFAERIADTVAAICAFATGRPVNFHPYLSPADKSEADAALSRRSDPAIGGLARDSVYLDPFDQLVKIGGADTQVRVRDALRTYHEALKAANPDVAVMLFVSSIEALFSPRQSWRKDKATKRFVTSMIELCPDAVDELLAHDNVESAFDYEKKGGVGRQRKGLLEQIYDTRSMPTHTGLSLLDTGLGSNVSGPGGMRVQLLSILAQAAILGFIQRPRSSLIGHPGIDPAGGAETQTPRPPNPLTSLMLPQGCEIEL